MRQIALGADGLTDDQWIESSRPGADPELAKQYREGNRNNEVLNNSKKSVATADNLEEIETDNGPGKGDRPTKLPAVGSTKNGTRVTLINGESYQMFNNKWVRLSGVSVNVNTYFNLAGDMPPLGIPPVNVDSAILDETRGHNISMMFGLKALLAGWGIDSAAKRKFSQFNSVALLLGFGYNGIKGTWDQYEANRIHDIETEPQLPKK